VSELFPGLNCFLASRETQETDTGIVALQKFPLGALGAGVTARGLGSPGAVLKFSNVRGSQVETLHRTQDCAQDDRYRSENATYLPVKIEREEKWSRNGGRTSSSLHMMIPQAFLLHHH